MYLRDWKSKDRKQILSVIKREGPRVEVLSAEDALKFATAKARDIN